jgi:hypothetical protein
MAGSISKNNLRHSWGGIKNFKSFFIVLVVPQFEYQSDKYE